MRNYGEELAYWYLRLNGFLVITDFVLHKSENISRSTDCDLLAVRLPGVEEPIGGQSHDWDPVLFSAHFSTEMPIGLIAESKTGNDAAKEFTSEQLVYAINRLGKLHPSQDISEILRVLECEPKYQNKHFQIGKILFSNETQKEDKLFSITFAQVREFLYQRFSLYEQKYPDRYFFPSTLLQMIIADVKEQRPKENRAKTEVSVRPRPKQK